ncbi:hypothetical protein AX17_003385 [Amanita inopinata Kibby_2008]|nr:hypothetical protein AX17_003385 [Amanita inopinata Kibby_2008]
MTDLLNPNSTAYKKARRQHHKATKNRQPDSHLDWSPFRAAEKRYKAHFPPPDLSDALDLAILSPDRQQEIQQGIWRGSPSAPGLKELSLKCPGGKKAYVVPRIPGLVIIPAFVNAGDQIKLIRWALCKHIRHNETNLDVHYALPQEGLWNAHLSSQNDTSKEFIVQPKTSPPAAELPSGPRQLVNNIPATPETFSLILSTPKLPPTPSPTLSPISASALLHKLRWANIGWFYHWGTKQYDWTRPKVPVDDIIRDLCQSAVEVVNWDQVFQGTEDGWGEPDPEWKTWAETYEPDAGIVNFYQTKDTLMAHVDRSEVCATSPLVSISLGNAAIFLIGGKTRDIEPLALILRSGDAAIMSGPECRRVYHGVPRILEGTLPPHLHRENVMEPDWSLYEDYMSTTRININVRQVFPKGFNPKAVS